MADRLNPNDQLQRGASLHSQNNYWRFSMQDDGNLVLYSQSGKPHWASGTNGKAAAGCIMQADGNLVIYGFERNALWASNTNNNANAYLVVQNDGNVVIYSSGDNRPLWATNTNQ